MKLKRILSSMLLCLTVLSSTAGTLSFMTDRGTGGGNIHVTSDDWTIKPYITFSSPSEFALKVNNNAKPWDGTMYWSTDGRNWNVWDGTQINSVGKRLHLRGVGNTRCSWAGGQFVINGSNVSCNGNIENLLNWQTVEAGNHPSVGEGAFRSMFYNCTALVSAPEMPLRNILKNACYEMFSGCTNLAVAPDLPVASIGESGCFGMFENCTSLIQPPVISATTLNGTYCCARMFSGCTKLRAAPELHAWYLPEKCYYEMFKGCVSLTRAPARIPAAGAPNQLQHINAMSCYRMFYGCTSLRIPPALPETNLAENCYAYMFCGCTSLSAVPALPALELPTSCYARMFDGAGVYLSATSTGGQAVPYRIPTSGNGRKTPSDGSQTYHMINTSSGYTEDLLNKTWYVSAVVS